MKISITGADILFDESKMMYNVIYKGRKVYSDNSKGTVTAFALDKVRLKRSLEKSNSTFLMV